MNTYTIRILRQDHTLLTTHNGEDFVDLVYAESYHEGDLIEIRAKQYDQFVHLQLDDSMGDALVYLTGPLCFEIPFGEKHTSYAPIAFTGACHYLYVRSAMDCEASQYRNLAKNQYDQHGDTNCYPHAYANVETRGEAVFAARNAIDGVCANLSHGTWPYQSWGINRREDAAITITFGRMVCADSLVLFTRADFPHDNWWTELTVHFSDGSDLIWQLEKSSLPHRIGFAPKHITSLTLDTLRKADDPSPFPALTQIEVYGV